MDETEPNWTMTQRSFITLNESMRYVESFEQRQYTVKRLLSGQEQKHDWECFFSATGIRSDPRFGEMRVTSTKLEQSPSRTGRYGDSSPRNEEASITKQQKSQKETVERPPTSFLKDGWLEIRYRKSGATAGSKDKYYVEKTTGYRFWSRCT